MFVKILGCWLLVISGITGCQNIDQEPAYRAYHAVMDGDTIKVASGEQEEILNLCGIDAPELDEPLGLAAKETLEALMKKGYGRVDVVWAGRDQDNQQMVEAWIIPSDNEPEIHVNSEMLAQGMAVVSPATVADCPNSNIYEIAESMAQENVLGVWKSLDPTQP